MSQTIFQVFKCPNGEQFLILSSYSSQLSLIPWTKGVYLRSFISCSFNYANYQSHSASIGLFICLDAIKCIISPFTDFTTSVAFFNES